MAVINITMNAIILAILKPYFKMSLKAVEAADRIWEVGGKEMISDQTLQERFLVIFRSG